MSRINDALKQARKTPPRNTPSTLSSFQPVAKETSPVAGKFLAGLVLVLIVAAIFSIGWAVSHHAFHDAVVAPEVADAPPDDAPPARVVQPPPVATPPPLNPPDAPKLQGIFYSATAPSAIVDGKTIRPGDKVGVFRVKAISKDTVTLVGPDKKEIKLGMNN